jgi:hypothetical protein
LTALAALLFVCSSAPAATAAHDAAWWASLSRSGRSAALDEMIEGYVRGWAAEHFRVRGLIESGVGRAPSWANEYVMSKAPGFHKPSMAYASAIDRFYALHRDARFVPVVNILDCLSDVPLRSCNAVALDAEIIIR